MRGKRRIFVSLKPFFGCVLEKFVIYYHSKALYAAERK